MVTLNTRWNMLCERLKIYPDPEEFQRLYRAYTEPHRAYHTLQHLSECWQHLDGYKQEHPTMMSDSLYANIEIALWYHDAIYRPRSAHNERKSADWAVDFLQRSGAKKTRCQQVDDLIMSTCHQQGHPVDASHAQQLVVDIDLAILGADKARFQHYEQQVREEYKWVPLFIYRKKRRAILQSFLDLPSIYSTVWFHTHFEQQARENLLRSLNPIFNP